MHRPSIPPRRGLRKLPSCFTARFDIFSSIPEVSTPQSLSSLSYPRAPLQDCAFPSRSLADSIRFQINTAGIVMQGHVLSIRFSHRYVHTVSLIVVIFHMELTLKQRIIPHYAEMQNFSCNCAFPMLYFSHRLNTGRVSAVFSAKLTSGIHYKVIFLMPICNGQKFDIY